MRVDVEEEKEAIMELGIIVEIRAAEGGADAKALVNEQLEIYGRYALRRRL